MSDLYFAYGSNLHAPRMRERVPSAIALGAHRLRGFQIHLDKPSQDGSAKANLRARADAWAWGVVYRLDAADWAKLDACEPGYTRQRVRVQAGEIEREAETYVALARSPEPVAFTWYKRLIVEGAREHRLPADWIDFLTALPARPDPDRP